MPNYSKVIVIGHLTRDIETDTVGEHTKYSGAVAVNDPFKKDREDQSKKHVSFVDFVFWNKRGEPLAKYTRKGDPVQVEGRIMQDRWTDNDGNKRSKIYIEGDSFVFLKSKGDSTPAQDGAPDPQPPVSEEDIPF